MRARRTRWRLSQPDAEKSTNSSDQRVAELAGRESGVLSVAELAMCGLDAQAVLVRTRNGRLHRMFQGVYAVGHARPSLRGHLLAALKACGPAAVLSHTSAGVLWGCLDRQLALPAHITLIGTSNRRHRGIRVHRCLRLPDSEIDSREGLPVTSALRTILDLASVLDERALRVAIRRVIGARNLTSTALARAVATTTHRPGIRKLRQVVADGLATRSELEDVVLALILDGGLARPDVNVPLVVGGRTVIPDFRWPQQRLIVEADGAAWHDQPIARREDLERQRLLEAHGETVLRVTWRQAIGAPRRTFARIARGGAPVADPDRLADFSAWG